MRTRVLRRSLSVAAAALLLAACGSSGSGASQSSTPAGAASSAAALPSVTCTTANAAKRAQLPQTIDLSCVGGTQQIRDVEWSAWDSDDGIGSGTLMGRDCSPVCTYVKGTDDLGPVSLTLSKPKRAGGGMVFTELTITPTTKAVPRTFTLPTS